MSHRRKFTFYFQIVLYLFWQREIEADRERDPERSHTRTPSLLNQITWKLIFVVDAHTHQFCTLAMNFVGLLFLSHSFSRFANVFDNIRWVANILCGMIGWCMLNRWPNWMIHINASRLIWSPERILGISFFRPFCCFFLLTVAFECIETTVIWQWIGRFWWPGAVTFQHDLSHVKYTTWIASEGKWFWFDMHESCKQRMRLNGKSKIRREKTANEWERRNEKSSIKMRFGCGLCNDKLSKAR